MFEGDRSRKSVLVEHGFRLPSALDNRPLNFAEYMKMTDQRVYVSATPGALELVNSRPENSGFIPVKNSDGSGIINVRDLKIRPSGSDESVDAFDPTQQGGI